MSKIRRASHAGSWYSDNKSVLLSQLNEWLQIVETSEKSAKAIIAPHAGYSYSGAAAAFAYKEIDPEQVNTIFVLGPSHHFHLDGCALSACDSFETPLYPLSIDHNINAKLQSTGLFQVMPLNVDEDEHSLEMHFPYIAKVMESQRGKFTIVPIMVGAISAEKEKQYGELLLPYILQPKVLFVISSDFCHWGSRFRFTDYDGNKGKIWQFIESLDKEGMDLIESLDATQFTRYLKEKKNTICGRHPIGLFLYGIDYLRRSYPNISPVIRFRHYAQSEHCLSKRDSSVSYASAVLNIK